MCARPARSSPSRTSTTGERATSADTIPTDTSRPTTRPPSCRWGRRPALPWGRRPPRRRAPTGTGSGVRGTRFRCGCRTSSSALPSWGDRNGGRPHCRIRASGLRPPRRRRSRPRRRRSRPTRARPPCSRLHGRADRAAGRIRRVRRPPQRPRRQARHHDRELPGHHRRGIPRRDQGGAAQHRPRRGLRDRGRRPHRAADRHARPARALHPRRRSPRQRARRGGFGSSGYQTPSGSTR